MLRIAVLRLLLTLRGRRVLAFAAFLLAVLGVVAAARPQAPPDCARLAFSRGGEVWIARRDGKSATQLTRTRGRVEEFSVAPAGDYLAYARTVRYVPEPGLLEPGETPGTRGVQSIVIMNLATRRTIAEIQPGDEWVYIDKWLPGGRLLGHASSGFDVTDVFEFDAATRQRRSLGLEAGGRLVEGDTAPDGSVSAYVDDTGLGPTYRRRLHLVDRGVDTIRVSQPSILAPRIAHAKGAVAFVEVTNGPGPARHRVWVLTLSTGELRAVHEDNARRVTATSWSLDDLYLAVSSGGATTIIDTRRAREPMQIRGTDPCWMSAGELVIAGQAGIELYDVAASARRPLVPRASSPRCLCGN